LNLCFDKDKEDSCGNNRTIIVTAFSYRSYMLRRPLSRFSPSLKLRWAKTGSPLKGRQIHIQF